jgi:opacity protein-like surface antigen
MTMRVLIVAMVLTIPSAAMAQEPTQPRNPPPSQPRPRPTSTRPRTPPPKDKLGIRGYAALGSTTLTAKETFDAVADTHSRDTFLGGVEVTNIWKGIFADVAATQLTVDGERVFISDGQVFNLGIPLQVKMRPVDIVGGWRFRFGRISPYAGAGVTFFKYEETSDFSQAGEDVSESQTGPMFLGGVDVQVWRFIHVGGELRYRRVNGILGDGGVSGEFDEDDAGGVGFAFRISIGT